MEKLKPYLMVSACSVIAVLAFSLLFDPTRADVKRMDALAALKVRGEPTPLGQPQAVPMERGAVLYGSKSAPVFTPRPAQPPTTQPPASQPQGSARKGG